MSRRASSPPPKPPTLTPHQARSQLEAALGKGCSLLEQNPITEERYKVWSENTWTILTSAFGEYSGHHNNFRGQVRIEMSPVGEHYAEAQRRQNLERRIRVLEAIIDGLPASPQPEAPTTVVQFEDFWSRLHPSVVQVSRGRFEAGHYADAVEAAFNELNTKIKAYVLKASNQQSTVPI
jgi:hypothetical protein